ncbi:MAG: flagellar hook-basal body protein [Planctomycetota bacterium]|jgi:flagellar basal-body rod protein FlgG
MIHGIYTSGLGAMAQNVRLDIIANNLANVNTPAFRRDQIAFQERLVEALEDVPDLQYYNSLVDRYGGAPFIETIRWDRSPGGAERTGRALDMLVDGKGYFVVQEIGSNRTYYTRAGDFALNGSGSVVTADGKYEVLSTDNRPLRIDTELSREIVVDANGTVFQKDNAGEYVALGTLAVRDFDDYDRLQKFGRTLFRDRGAGVRDVDTPRIQQGFLETASANPVTEMVEMIKAMRVLESNLNMIRMQDGTLDRLVNDFGRLPR